MTNRRVLIFVLMFFLATINYVDRVVLSVSATPIAKEFDITPVQLGYLFSSFLWLYVLCLVPMGMIVDRFGTRAVNAAGIGFVWLGAWLIWFRLPEKASWLSSEERAMILRERGDGSHPADATAPS